MTHWKTFIDKDFLADFDLQGQDVNVTIEKVTGGEITGEGGKKNRKPVAHLVGKKKKLALNSTNCKVIESLYGKDVEGWAGKRITLYPTTTQFGGKEVGCIRIRPKVPAAAKTGERDLAPENGADQ